MSRVGTLAIEEKIIFVFVIVMICLFVLPSILYAINAIKYDKCGLDVNEAFHSLFRQFGQDKDSGYQPVIAGSCVKKIIVTNNWMEASKIGGFSLGNLKCDITKPSHILVVFDYAWLSTESAVADNPYCIGIPYRFQLPAGGNHLVLEGGRSYCFRYQIFTDSKGIKTIDLKSPASSDEVIRSVTECA
jgi:hypothetical protein